MGKSLYRRLPPKIPILQAQLQTRERARRTLRRSELVVVLLVCVRISCPIRGEGLSGLLWDQRHGVAELFEAVDMVTLDPFPIPLLKVISSQIGIGFLAT
jgi:hypothetical protein